MAPRRTTCSSGSPRSRVRCVVRRSRVGAATRCASSAARREQVDEFLDEVVDPILAGARAATNAHARGGARMTHRGSSTPLPLRASAARQSARGLRRRRRSLAARRDRPRERVRRRDERGDPVQGRGAHADHRLVAASARARCPASHDLRRRRRDHRATFRRWRTIAHALAGRAMLCRRTDVFPVECVIRGYLSGSAWKEYERVGHARRRAARRRTCGRASASIRRSSALRRKPRPGTMKTSRSAAWREIIGADVAARARAARAAWSTSAGATIAAERGIIIADTKFEFGRDREGAITLIDEVLTPDSSRFWPAEHYQPGRSQPSFDKQPLRDYLDGERRAGRWNGEAPPPPLPRACRARDERALSRCLPPHHRLQLDLTELS